MRGWCGLLLAVFVFACGCTAKNEPAPILVGHVAPLSGGDKARGEHGRQGIRLAVEEAGWIVRRAFGVGAPLVELTALALDKIKVEQAE